MQILSPHKKKRNFLEELCVYSLTKYLLRNYLYAAIIPMYLLPNTTKPDLLT